MATYKLWHEFLPHFPKTARYGLGGKIDNLFIEILEILVIAKYEPKKTKLPWVLKASQKLDILKFFLQVGWEIKAMDNKKYIALSEKIDEVGRMLGGWSNNLKKQNPPSC